jgi:hypothetical protein
MKTIPALTSNFNFTDYIEIGLNDNQIYLLHLLTNGPLKTQAMRLWLSEIETEGNRRWVWGYFNMVISVKEGYTGRTDNVAME